MGRGGSDSEMTVVAKLNYIPSSLHELALFKGEKLSVEDSTGDWWRVRNALGQTGLIPASYIRMRNESFLSKLLRRSSRGNKKQSQDKKHTAINISSPQDFDENSGLVSDNKFPSSNAQDCKPPLQDGLVQNFTPSSPMKDSPFKKSGDLFDPNDLKMQQWSSGMTTQTPHHERVDFVAQVRYNYKAQRDDELELKQGEEVIVLERASDGWWKGVNQTTHLAGWFPSNYVLKNNANLPSRGSTGTDLDGGKNTDFCGGAASDVFANVGAVPMIQGVATATYLPITQLELKINGGDQLHILRECSHSPSHWEARNQSNGGETGLVLKSYVQVSSPITKDSPVDSPAGCQLNIVGPEGAAEWTEKEAAGAVGGVGSSLALPFQLPPKMGMFKNEDWYFGKVFRAQCEILFKYYGDFGDYLIRDSESNPGDFTLSLKANMKNRHFLVKSVGANRLKIGNKDFPSMGELLAHYKFNAIFTDAQGTRLVLVKPLRVGANRNT